MSCGVGHRCNSDLALLWLWRGSAAVALIWLLAWEHPYAANAALKKRQKTKKKKKKRIHLIPDYGELILENIHPPIHSVLFPLPSGTPSSNIFNFWKLFLLIFTSIIFNNTEWPSLFFFFLSLLLLVFHMLLIQAQRLYYQVATHLNRRLAPVTASASISSIPCGARWGCSAQNYYPTSWFIKRCIVYWC